MSWQLILAYLTFLANLILFGVNFRLNRKLRKAIKERRDCIDRLARATQYYDGSRGSC